VVWRELTRWPVFVKEVVKGNNIKCGLATQGLNEPTPGHEALVAIAFVKELIAEILILGMQENSLEQHVTGERPSSIGMCLEGGTEELIVVVLVGQVHSRHEFASEHVTDGRRHQDVILVCAEAETHATTKHNAFIGRHAFKAVLLSLRAGYASDRGKQYSERHDLLHGLFFILQQSQRHLLTHASSGTFRARTSLVFLLCRATPVGLWLPLRSFVRRTLSPVRGR